MLMLMKNRFGVNMMIFVFLLSFYNAMAIETKVSYTALDRNLDLENELKKQINKAVNEEKYFYIGVAKAHGTPPTPIQSLCKRQGEPNALPKAKRCVNKSQHVRDKESRECGFELTQVFYANGLDKEGEVCGIEKRLIADYYNNCEVHEFCLNRQVGKDKCLSDNGVDKGKKEIEGIVYLRIYEDKSKSNTLSGKKRPRPYLK